MWKIINVFSDFVKNSNKGENKLNVKEYNKSSTDKFVGDYLFDSGL